MLVIFYLGFLILLLGFIWFITGLILIFANRKGAGNIKVAIKFTVISFIAIIVSILMIFLSDKYLAAHYVAPESTSTTISN